MVPAGGGVLTSWRHQGATGTGTGRLQVWTLDGGTIYTLAGRSDVETLAAGTLNEHGTRIPVSGGEILGLRTAGTDIGCVSDLIFAAQDVASTDGQNTADPAPGEPRDMSGLTQTSVRVNVAATLEPDADGDGFGDESQDVELEVTLKNKLRPKRSGFPVKVSCGDSECEGTIKGKAIAKQKGGSSATVAKKQSFKLKPKTLSIAADETKKTKLKLKKSKSSTKQLGRLLRNTRKGSKLKLTVTATNTLGASDKVKSKAKLKPGQFVDRCRCPPPDAEPVAGEVQR